MIKKKIESKPTIVNYRESAEAGPVYLHDNDETITWSFLKIPIFTYVNKVNWGGIEKIDNFMKDQENNIGF